MWLSHAMHIQFSFHVAGRGPTVSTPRAHLSKRCTMAKSYSRPNPPTAERRAKQAFERSSAVGMDQHRIISSIHDHARNDPEFFHVNSNPIAGSACNPAYSLKILVKVPGEVTARPLALSLKTSKTSMATSLSSLRPEIDRMLHILYQFAPVFVWSFQDRCSYDNAHSLPPFAEGNQSIEDYFDYTDNTYIIAAHPANGS